MRKFLILIAVLLALGGIAAGCKKEAEEAIEPSEDIVIVEATDQRIVTDKEEIENYVIEYGIPMEAESITRIIETEIDASIFD